MPLEQKGKVDLKFDALDTQSNIAISFSPFKTEFTWFRFDMQRQFHFIEKGQIAQLCGNYMVKLNLQRSQRFTISFFGID